MNRRKFSTVAACAVLLLSSLPLSAIKPSPGPPGDQNYCAEYLNPDGGMLWGCAPSSVGRDSGQGYILVKKDKSDEYWDKSGATQTDCPMSQSGEYDCYDYTDYEWSWDS